MLGVFLCMEFISCHLLFLLFSLSYLINLFISFLHEGEFDHILLSFREL